MNNDEPFISQNEGQETINRNKKQGNKKTFEADNDYLKYFADFMKKYLSGFHIGSDLP